MTREELHSILENFAISEEDAQEKFSLIWGQPFDGETEKINTTKSVSLTSAIPQTNASPFVGETDVRVAEFEGKMSAISQAHEMWIKPTTQPQ
jgi:hypothetical protein